jgi:lysozyme
MFVRGVDVSHHQGEVKWPLVAATEVRFAYAKATEGKRFRDPAFGANWPGIKSAGLRRGAYHFFRPAHPLTAQIDFFASVVGSLDPTDLAPMLDIEEVATESGGDQWDAIAPEERVPLILNALGVLEAQLGRRPIVYVRRGFVSAKLPNAQGLAAYPLWIAHYTDATQPITPLVWDRWTIWQHSEKGQVAGIDGHVDLDQFNGGLDELDAMLGALQ